MENAKPRTPITGYLKAVAGDLIVCTIIFAPISYAIYQGVTWVAERSIPPGQILLVLEWGPFGGWRDMWLLTATIAFIASLPKTLLTTYKRRGRKRPGGVMFGFGPDGDERMLKTMHDWLLRHTELLRTADLNAPARERFPECPRCGDPVSEYEFKPKGWTVMRFNPCRCTIKLNNRLLKSTSVNS